ncbi:MAG: hypothetical protein ACI865_000392 [Flavobacteriaceae bacterium]|jgi:hypothetical protein
MKASIALIFILLLKSSISQEVIKATRQNWAGGVCCVSGTNFHVTLKIRQKLSDISIEDVWLQQDEPLVGSILKDPTSKNTYHISFGFSRNEIAEFDHLGAISEPKKDQSDVTKIRPEFKAKALIILVVSGKKIEILIEEFETLSMLAYP